jgi:hypothetical protein
LSVGLLVLLAACLLSGPIASRGAPPDKPTPPSDNQAEPGPTVALLDSLAADTDLVLFLDQKRIRSTPVIKKSQGSSDALQVKVHDKKDRTVLEIQYELIPPVFATTSGLDTVVLSPYREDLLTVAGKPDPKDTAQRKHLGRLLARVKNDQALWFGVLGQRLQKEFGGGRKEAFFNQTEDVLLGISFEKDIRIELEVTAKTAKAAEDVQDDVQDGLNALLGLVALLATEDKGLALLVDDIQVVKPRLKDRTVSVSLVLREETCEKLGAWLARHVTR